MRTRTDVTRAADLERFLSWLTGRHTQRELGGGTGRSFRDRHAWCWNIQPTIEITGEIYDQIQLDGTYLTGGWCLLLAINGATGHVFAWQWCDTEKTQAWEALLARIPPPRVVVIDGGQGLASALRTTWPTSKIQRCLVHVQRGVRTYLTMRPRTDAGKALRGLSLALTRIRTADEAIVWQTKLHDWYQVYGALTRHKTHLKDTRVRPTWARAHASWWWTHDRLRQAYQLLAKLVRQNVLFTYLLPEFEGLGISSTTNRIEGGANHPIKELLRLHRGMTSDHRRRSAEWWCYLHAENPQAPATLIRVEHYTPKPALREVDEPIGPAVYDTHFTPDEGIGIRVGWGGRSR